ncbi:MAG: hypothetical protein V4649_11820 [Bacteroidota bacterium]
MKLSLLTLLLAFISLPAYSQEEYQNFGQAYAFEPRQQVYVFDTATIRLSPDPRAELMIRVAPGRSLFVVQTGKMLTINNKSAPWVQVTYHSGGPVLKGFVWSGQLSPRALNVDDVQFVYGMRFGKDPGDESVVTVRALRNDSLIATVSFKAGHESSRGVHEASVMPSKGMEDLKKILHFYYSGEACGIPVYDQYIGWDGSRLTLFPVLLSASEAGISYVEEKYIFPADKGGKSGQIIKRTETAEYDENDKITNKKVATTRYRWHPAKGLIKL